MLRVRMLTWIGHCHGESGTLVVTSTATTREAIAAKQAAENFPVALRALPAALRRDLTALYRVARTIDDLGDEGGAGSTTEMRLAMLDDYEAQLRRTWAGEAIARPELVELSVSVRARDLSIEPFLSLVAANRLDQVQATYANWADLRHYCTLSADPIGRTVLEIVDASTPDNVARSDQVCTALQVLEHCQDVAEDRRRGRTYLPADDLARFGVADADLDAGVTSKALRAAVEFEVDRAHSLLESGRTLVRSLRGTARLAVTGFVAGGLATVDALHRCDFDVINPAVSAKPSRRSTARHAFVLLAGRS
jgi:squalene synthase HpnC